MEQTVSTVQDHRSYCLFEFFLTATLDFFQRSFGRLAWDLFRYRFFLLELFSTLRLSTFCLL